jgi:ABC-type polysaccharide/polyol phosphate export permease
MTALAVGLWSSAINVKYRDVSNMIPFLIQVWMYASPVAYPISMVPEKWRLLYSLNPMVGVIEGFRWALLGKKSPDFMLMAVSSVVVLELFTSKSWSRHLPMLFNITIPRVSEGSMIYKISNSSDRIVACLSAL